MTDDSPEPSEKRVGWAELYFDLVFVVAVTRVSSLIEHHHEDLGLLRALIVFIPIYWTWVGASMLTNQNDAERLGLRLRLFAVALAGIFMSLAVEDAYGDTGLLLALAYWGGRLVLASTILKPLLARQYTVLNPYVLSAVVTGPLLVVGSLLDATPRTVVWAVAAALDLGGPTLFRSRMRSMHFDAAHLSERFGLFVLIALGESVVVVATAPDPAHLDVAEVTAVAAAFVVSVGMWWVYFHFAADAVRHALATAEVQLDITRLVLSYGHLAFIGAVIAVAVGLHEAVGQPVEHLGWSSAALLYGGAAVYLATFGFTRWTMFHLVSRTRLTAAAVLVVLLPVAHLLSGLAALCVLAGVLVALNAYELRSNDRIGWRARQRETSAVEVEVGVDEVDDQLLLDDPEGD